jgi:tetratricopeptide (TPR) repeat protein
MNKILLLIFIIANSVAAQNSDSLFVSANKFYKAEAFEKAIEAYKKIEAQDTVSVALYLNLGNTYYKLNKVGPAIFYYEKALQLDPINKDVINNLVFAKRLALDNIAEVPKTMLQRFQTTYLQKLTYNSWAILTVVLSFITTVLFLLFYFAYTPSRKRIYFATCGLSLLLFVFSIFITYSQYSWTKSNKKGIIFAEKTAIRNAPTLNAEAVFTLHEGAKVSVLDAIDNWKKIKLSDGRQGWIIADEVKLLSDF